MGHGGWRAARRAGPVARASRVIRQAGVMAETLTLMAVHAHPDDESSSTGGVLAKYSAEGIRTVVVTCTNGEFGDAPGQVKPGQDGHDTTSVAKIRLTELEVACKHLGVSDLEVLGYHDSGMPDWDYKDRPDVFSNVPLAAVTDRVAGLIGRYRPQVVVTYDDNGGYQHPDHLHASRAAVAAVTATGIPSKLYLTAMRTSGWREVWEALRARGEEVPDFSSIDPEMQRMMEESERRITTTVDIRDVLDRKGDALRAHASQIQDSWFSKIPPEIVARVFGQETFIRASDATGSPVPENDLFAGLR
jgi:LmbE family N-acetylglucosaminyl deacetylase